LNLFPIDIKFERSSQADGESKSKTITRNLYHRLNPLPQKKVMTFNRKPNDFHFNSSYGDLTFLNEELKSTLDLDTLINYRLSGVEEAHKKNEKLSQKGVKAYFMLDESGLLSIEKIEAHFEKTPEQAEEDEQSTFQKLGSKLSSFFGSGKKEGEDGDETEKTEGDDKKEEENKTEAKTKTEEKTEKKEEKKTKSEDKKEKVDDKKNQKEEPKADKDATDKTNKTDDKSGNKTEEVKPKKPVLVKEEITFKQKFLDVGKIGKKAYAASVKKLNELQARDMAKLATEKARNELETHAFEFKDKLTSEEVEKLSSKEERAKITEALTKASEWLDEEGFDADEETFKKKLKALKELSTELRLRMAETEERPKAITSMLQSLNLTSSFLDSMGKLPDAKEIYTDKDFSDIEKKFDETKTWFNTNWKKFNESDLTKKPVFLSKDIYYEQNKLDREMMFLINKAKYYVPKPKPKPKVNSTETDSNTTKSDTKKKSGEKQTTKDEKSKTTDNKSEEKKTSTDKKDEEVKKEKKTEKDTKKTEDTKKEEETTTNEENTKEEEKTKAENDKKSSSTHHEPEDEL